MGFPVLESKITNIDVNVRKTALCLWNQKDAVVTANEMKVHTYVEQSSTGQHTEEKT